MASEIAYMLIKLIIVIVVSFPAELFEEQSFNI